MAAKLFILIRSDLSEGQRAVQAGHAVAEWCKRWMYYGNQDWNNETLIYLMVPDFPHLVHWQRKLELKGEEYAAFFEPDMQNQMTALACYTDSNIFSGLKMLGE